MKLKILFITGSINQTTQMHKIANELTDYECWFSQIFVDFPPFQWLIDNTKILSKTVVSGQFKENSEKYCQEQGLKMDYKAKKNQYDLVVYCSDMIIPDRMLQTKTLWVQEGMIDEYTSLSKVIKKLHLPPYFAVGTALNGASNICDVYCSASEGYKKRLVKIGTDSHKIVTTGIPNFDNVEQYRQNDFPLRDFVLVATSDNRECFRKEDRPAFIKECVEKAAGRKLVFKLHPNEIMERAVAEIKEYAPAETIIYITGDINPMIANCDEFITQYSSAVYIGMALGKKVHSYFDIEELKQQMPIQNGGKSAEIKEHAPAETIIYITGDINPMIANCDEFITQYSSAVYIGMALGKKVYSYFDIEELKQQMPIQNGGKSAKNIAQICRDFLAFIGKKEDFMKNYRYKIANQALIYEQ